MSETMASEEVGEQGASAPSQFSNFENIRTVEFRQALRGYNIDDVDEYLENLAAEAEALFGQLRTLRDGLLNEQARSAALERSLTDPSRVQQAASPEPPAVAAEPQPVSGDTLETLQRTLVLAQKFVDQTQVEAEEQAARVIADAEHRAQGVLAQAEGEARKMIADTEGAMREEVSRLESIKGHLAGDVENMGRHLEGERLRLRGTLMEMLKWVDDQLKPAAAMLERRDEPGAQPQRMRVPSEVAASGQAPSPPAEVAGPVSQQGADRVQAASGTPASAVQATPGVGTEASSDQSAYSAEIEESLSLFTQGSNGSH